MNITETEFSYIDALLRNIVDNDDDILQDCWLEVIKQDNLQDNDIKKIAKQISKQAKALSVSEGYKLTSISKPLGNTDDFTFEKILSSNSNYDNLRYASSKYRTNGSQPAQKRKKTSIAVSQDVIEHIRKKVPDRPLTQALRMVLGLEIEEKREAWQLWEDDIIKEKYPCGGTLLVSVDIKRSPDAIRERARQLGVRKTKLRPKTDYFAVNEVSALFHCSPSWIHKLINNGELEAIKVNGPGKIYTFITMKAIETFIQQHPLSFSHDNIHNSLKHLIPKHALGWITTGKAIRKFNISKSHLYRAIHNSHVSYIITICVICPYSIRIYPSGK